MSDAAKLDGGDDRPRLFISHKHLDGEIAAEIADFIRKTTANKVKIHLSSDPQYDGPRIGRNLNEELRKALWRTDALVLLYTTEDQDWSYCMYECGLATDPAAPSSSIYVLQCGAIAPAPFMDTVRVNARDLDALKRFVRDLLRSREFFPRRPQALLPEILEKDCDEYAKELHARLEKVLPPYPPPKPDERWQTWPFLTLEIASTAIDKASAAQQPENGCGKLGDEVYNALLEACIVTGYDEAQTPSLFGKASFPETLGLKDLVRLQPEAPNGDAWVRCCLSQILKASKRGFVTMGWTPLKDPRSRAQYLPALCEVRQSHKRGVMAFDIFFLDVLSPEAMPARNRMMALGDFYSLDLGDPATRARKLAQLRQEMQRGSRSRLPILDGRNTARSIVHKSLIDEFLLGALDRPGDYGVTGHSDLNLGHLLDDPAFGKIAEKTFGTVGPDETVADVEKAMRDVPDCRDVFVTQDGTREGAVLGWLTNVSLGR